MGLDLLDGLAGWVVKFPVLIMLAWKKRAGIAAAHRHDHIGGQDEFVGPGLRELWGDVDSDFCHGGNGFGVDDSDWLGAARPGDRPAFGQVGKPAEGHLRAPGVVHAEEQHGGDFPAAWLSAWARARSRWRVNRSAAMTSQRLMLALAASSA
jgi:hypothetical protein